MLIADIIKEIEKVAPLHLQESWDNSGLQVGNPLCECTGVMICLDCTPAILDEAIAKGCNLIVSHHPLIFSGLKKLSGATPTEATVMNAIAAGVTVYSSHTAMDSSSFGINRTMAEMLGLENIEVLAPQRNGYIKATVTVPRDFKTEAGLAMTENLALTVSESTLEDTATIEAFVPQTAVSSLSRLLAQTVPDGNWTMFTTPADNCKPATGLGAVGTLPVPMTARQLALHAKKVFACQGVRVTASDINSGTDANEPLIRRVALCGGAGGSLIKDALRARAQAFITSDIRYHDFVEYSGRLFLADVGHFDSELCAKQIFFNIITGKFRNFAVYCATNETNPIKFL